MRAAASKPEQRRGNESDKGSHRVRRPTFRLLGTLIVCGVIAGTTLAAAGQDRGRGRREANAPRAERSRSAEEVDVEASEEVEERGGAKVKVFEFSGLDISGRLKSPQLLYFLNRLRAEFNRPRLPHRSFMPELHRSTKGRSFE